MRRLDLDIGRLDGGEDSSDSVDLSNISSYDFKKKEVHPDGDYGQQSQVESYTKLSKKNTFAPAVLEELGY